MRSDGSDEDQEYRTESARLLQQELRHMRDTYLGFKEAVDTALRDHEIRLRSLQQTQYLTLGGGAVVGWIFSVVLRMFFK